MQSSLRRLERGPALQGAANDRAGQVIDPALQRAAGERRQARKFSAAIVRSVTGADYRAERDC